MVLTNVQLLLTVNFLHYLCAGLVAPVVTRHIVLNGGNHIILGGLAAALFLCHKMSKECVGIFEHGKKFTIKFCLTISLLICLLMLSSYSYWIICMTRCLYALTNQVSFYSKEYLKKSEPPEKYNKICHLLDASKVIAVVIGSIAGGYIFDYFEDFGPIGAATSVFTFLAILFLQHVDDDVVPSSPPQTNFFSLSSNLENFRKIEFSSHWDVILLKIIYSLSFTIYFSRFAFLLSSNYQVGCIIIGYTVAYQYMLKFACDSFMTFLPDEVKKNHNIFEFSLAICGFSLNGLYYAPTYEIFLIVFLPLIITYTIVNSAFENDVLKINRKIGLNEVIETLKLFFNFFGLFFFGFFCQNFGGKAFKLLAALPITVCIYLLNRKFIHVRSEDSREEIKED